MLAVKMIDITLRGRARGKNLPTATRVNTLFLMHTKKVCNRKQHKKCALQEAAETEHANESRWPYSLTALIENMMVSTKWAKRVFLKYDNF